MPDHEFPVHYWAWVGGKEPIRYAAVSAQDAANIWANRHRATTTSGAAIHVVADEHVETFRTSVLIAKAP